jgi:hypothetical protein
MMAASILLGAAEAHVMLCSLAAFGSTIVIEADDPDLFHHLDQWLPAFAAASSADVPRVHYKVRASRNHVMVMRGRRALATGVALPAAARVLAADVVVTLSRTSPDWTFIHAGVVGINGRAIILPGASHAGKSTLVAALVRDGAEYGSDEFAVIDTQGRVRPWARWLGVRRDGHPDERLDPRTLGARFMGDDVPVAAIVFTSWHRDHPQGAGLALRRVPPGEAALRMLPHCLTARARTGTTLRALSGLAAAATAFEGPRAEATEFAGYLRELGAGLAAEAV